MATAGTKLYEPEATTPLRIYRVAAGHSQRSLAAASGVSRLTIYRCEKGITQPHRATAAALAAALKRPTEAVFPPNGARTDSS